MNKIDIFEFKLFIVKIMNNLLSTFIKFFLIAGLSVSFAQCNSNCEVNNPTCNELPPTNEMCQAYFERWFYNKNTGNCSLQSYSGCGEYGFATQQECEACECN
jgi:hypothetical protein